jgi:hypothetical protein
MTPVLLALLGSNRLADLVKMVGQVVVWEELVHNNIGNTG